MLHGEGGACGAHVIGAPIPEPAALHGGAGLPASSSVVSPVNRFETAELRVCPSESRLTMATNSGAGQQGILPASRANAPCIAQPRKSSHEQDPQRPGPDCFRLHRPSGIPRRWCTDGRQRRLGGRQRRQEGHEEGREKGRSEEGRSEEVIFVFWLNRGRCDTCPFSWAQRREGDPISVARPFAHRNHGPSAGPLPSRPAWRCACRSIRQASPSPRGPTGLARVQRQDRARGG